VTSPLWGGEQIPATPPQNLEVMKEDKSGQTCESDKDLWFPDANKDLSLLEWQIARADRSSTIITCHNTRESSLKATPPTIRAVAKLAADITAVVLQPKSLARTAIVDRHGMYKIPTRARVIS
jgi:hypothetical protein